MVEPRWHISALPTRNRVTLRYWGYTSNETIINSLKELHAALPRAPVVLVVDVRELEGNNPDSRDLWQTFLREHRAMLKAVYLILPRTSVFYRMLAVVVGLGAGVRLSFVESPSEIP